MHEKGKPCLVCRLQTATNDWIDDVRSTEDAELVIRSMDPAYHVMVLGMLITEILQEQQADYRQGVIGMFLREMYGHFEDVDQRKDQPIPSTHDAPSGLQ